MLILIFSIIQNLIIKSKLKFVLILNLGLKFYEQLPFYVFTENNNCMTWRIKYHIIIHIIIMNFKLISVGYKLGNRIFE